MAEDKNYTNNKERPREDEELEIDLMEYVRKLWAARKVLLKAAGIGAIVGVIIALSIPKQYWVTHINIFTCQDLKIKHAVIYVYNYFLLLPVQKRKGT